MKRTIIVVYSNVKLTKAQLAYQKRYTFNTDSDVKVGDLLETKAYDTNLFVVDVLEKEYKYFNKVTGKMSNDYDSTNQFEIKTLKVVEKDDDEIVIAHKKEV